jgi:hypothetical protein
MWCTAHPISGCVDKPLTENGEHTMLLRIALVVLLAIPALDVLVAVASLMSLH